MAVSHPPEDKMLNCEMRIDNEILTIEVDLSKTFGPSKSGKTIVIASTKGNKEIGNTGCYIGLNVYKYKED